MLVWVSAAYCGHGVEEGLHSVCEWYNYIEDALLLKPPNE